MKPVSKLYRLIFQARNPLVPATDDVYYEDCWASRPRRVLRMRRYKTLVNRSRKITILLGDTVVREIKRPEVG